jgi:hypothetical protein
MIEPSVERFGTFQANGEQRKQSGVLRINCIDCLDRTNVVQGWLARKQLDRLLTQLSLLPSGSSIKEAFPEVTPCALLTGTRACGQCSVGLAFKSSINCCPDEAWDVIKETEFNQAKGK